MVARDGSGARRQSLVIKMKVRNECMVRYGGGIREGSGSKGKQGMSIDARCGGGDG